MHDLHIAFIGQQSVNERLTDDEMIDGAVRNGQRRERRREPRTTQARIEYAAARDEAVQPVVEQLTRRKHTCRAKHLGLVAVDPVVVVKVEQIAKHDVGHVPKQKFRQDLPHDSERRHKLSHAKHQGPCPAGRHHAHDAKRKAVQ